MIGKDYTAEFFQVAQRAWDHLCRFYDDPALASRRVVFWCGLRTSFENDHAWVIQEDRSDVSAPTLTASRATWRRVHDLKNFATIQARLQHPWPYPPTFETTDIPIDQDSTRSALESLCRCPVPPAKTSEFGIDGHTWYFRYRSGSSEHDLHWWVRPPQPWLELRDALRNLLDTIDPNSSETLERYW